MHCVKAILTGHLSYERDMFVWCADVIVRHIGLDIQVEDKIHCLFMVFFGFCTDSTVYCGF